MRQFLNVSASVFNCFFHFPSPQKHPHQEKKKRGRRGRETQRLSRVSERKEKSCRKGKKGRTKNHFSTLASAKTRAPYLADLGGLRVRGLADLVLLLLGEADAEQAHVVAVSGLDVREALDQRVPLLDQRLQLVRGEVHACRSEPWRHL